MSFAGKAAVVTGAGGGMGLNVACDLLAAGVRVTGLDLKPQPAGLAGGEGRLLYLEGDLSEESFVADAFARHRDVHGRLDYLVNAAGVLWFGRDRSLLDIEIATWERVIDIDLKALMLTARQAVPLMRAGGGGAMVHVSSIQALRGDPAPQDAYQAAKAGVIALSKSIAVQFAADGIRSNALLPGPTESPLQARWEHDPEMKRRTAAAVPLGRVGTTQDMADAVSFLLSDRASFITGTELVVDGGCTALP